MATVWTESELGDVLEALKYPREVRIRFLFSMQPVDLGLQLVGQKVALVGEQTKALALELAGQILTREAEAFEEALDGLPNVSRFEGLHKDEQRGFEIRQIILDKMRGKLATMLNVEVNRHNRNENQMSGLNARVIGLTMPASGFSKTINIATLALIPSPCHLALNSAMPADDDGQGGTEFSLSGLGYAAQSVTWGSTTTDVDGKVFKANTTQPQFGPFTATTPTVVGYTIWNHPTNRLAANFIAAVPYDVGDRQAFTAGSTYTFNVGVIKLKAD